MLYMVRNSKGGHPCLEILEISNLGLVALPPPHMLYMVRNSKGGHPCLKFMEISNLGLVALPPSLICFIWLGIAKVGIRVECGIFF